MIAGGVTFGAMYFTSLVAGIGVLAVGGNANSALFFLPVFGPFIAAGFAAGTASGSSSGFARTIRASDGF